MKLNPKLPTAAAVRMRRQAESVLRKNRPSRSSKATEPPSAADSRRLNHELQVHQVELELQNAELRQARDHLEEALENYTDLYDFAPVGYFTLAESGTIQQLNLTGARMAGVERSRLVGRPFGHLVSPDFRSTFQAFLKQVFASRAGHSGEVDLAIAGQPRRSVKLEARRVPNGRECRIAVIDISDRKRAEAVLRDNEALFSTLIEQAPLGVYVVDAQFRLRQVNPPARAVFRAVRLLIGRDFSEVHRLLWPKQISDVIVARFRNTLRTGESFQAHEHSVPGLNSKDTRIYDWQLHRVTLPGGDSAVVCYFNDITERKAAEQVNRQIAVLCASNQKLEREIIRRRTTEIALKKSERHQSQMLKRSQRLQKQLKRLPQLILSAQEEERKRISRELHDVIAQTLTGINLSLSELRTQGGYKSATLDRAQTMISRAIDSVHGFARELRPAVLDDIGLIPALRTFLSDFATLTGIHTKLTGPAIADPSEPAVRTVLFRVAQEALQNVARHAEASHVAVDIHSSAEGVVMTIRNDGRPFDVTRALNFTLGRRLGLIGMRERLEMVGGDLSVESTPNRGTVVTARIPHSKTVRRKRLPRP